MGRQISKLRREVLSLLDELTAIVILSNSICAEALPLLHERRIALKGLRSPKSLAVELNKLRAEVSDWRADQEVSATAEELANLLSQVNNSPHEQIAFVRKSHISKVIGRYKYWPRPAHCQVGISKDGLSPDLAYKWRLAEAMLYEDMCSLYNLACDAEQPPANGVQAFSAKYAGTLRRSVVVMAFDFLEAYLNGLAYDFLSTTDRKLSLDERDMLTEWDTKKGSPKFISLRSKLLQYPRIISDAQHPPLQETNCKALKFVLDQAKFLRDSIVHTSPSVDDPNEPMSSKEFALFSIDQPIVDLIVDQTIELIRRLERTVRGNEAYLDWLVDRSEGRFPEAAFA